MITEKASSIFWLLVGLFFCINAYKIGLGEFREPGPGFIFFLGGAILSLLSIINLINVFLGRTKISDSQFKLWTGLNWEKPVLILLIFFGCVYFIKLFGFWLASFFLITLALKIIEPMKWWVTIAAALLTIFLAYAVFEIWLKVPFAKGFLGL